MKCEWTCGQSRVSAKRASATSTRASGCNVCARRSARVKDSFMMMVTSKPGAKAGVCVDVESDDLQIAFEMDETVVWSPWSGLVRDEGAELEEGGDVTHRLGEEIRVVVSRGDEGHVELEGFDHVADVEVTALDVLHAEVVLGIVGGVASAFVVGAERRGSGDGEGVESANEFAEVDHILGSFG